MKKYFSEFLISVIAICLLVYAFPQSPEFPDPPKNFVRSFEPADIETSLRRGYYTDLTRAEVIAHYEDEFNKNFKFLNLNIGFLAPRLNYPPEEAQTIIRDQTKSTFLEELVHPLRESLYINGYEPKEEQYAQYYEGKRYKQKIIVKYVPSSFPARIFVVLLFSVILRFFLREVFYAKKKN